MKFKFLISFFIILLFSGCDQFKINQSNKLKLKPEYRFKNMGFTLIYNENLDLKKLDQRSLNIFHHKLKKNSLVKITNPSNGKSLLAKVKSNKVEFSKFYNSVISSRIAETLELEKNEPLIEISSISPNSTFIAKKAKTFNEEKVVAEKAPIDGIKIKDLKPKLSKNLEKKKNKSFLYSIKVADFYYKKTALLMINRIKSETNLKNLKIIEFSKTNYRVLIGPFNDIKTLKEAFEKMKSLNFENLEILKDV